MIGVGHKMINDQNSPGKGNSRYKDVGWKGTW